MKSIYYVFLLTIALFSCEKPISDFQSENFIKFFGSGYESKGNDVIELSDGGYLITGYDKLDRPEDVAKEVLVVKVDKNGNLIWSKTYGQVDFSDEGKVVKEVSDGYLIAGISINSGITHSFILKTDFDGEQVYFREFGSSSYSITINDIVVTDNNIFVAGYSDTAKVGATDYYVAKLNNLAELVLDKPTSIHMNCGFRKIYFKNDNLMLIGTNGSSTMISITQVNSNSLAQIDGTYIGTSGESVVDAHLDGDQFYVLSTGTIKTKVSKLDSNFGEVWNYQSSTIVARSIVYKEDGSLIICGESNVDGNSQINFIKINADGSVFNAEQYFKSFSGKVGRIIETKDKGLIMVGSTNPTYGTNVQLIKTDKDLFLLKP